jgi:predicted RNase H-like HicB family nuclease
MLKNFSLEYWTDDNWYVGRLKEIPGIFSQGETLEELEDNIKDAYELRVEEEALLPEKEIHTKEIGIDV